MTAVASGVTLVAKNEFKIQLSLSLICQVCTWECVCVPSAKGVCVLSFIFASERGEIELVATKCKYHS